MKTATNLLPKLTPTQALLLRTAARRANGRVIPPDSLRGGARANTLTGLQQRGWIEPIDGGLLLSFAARILDSSMSDIDEVMQCLDAAARNLSDDCKHSS